MRFFPAMGETMNMRWKRMTPKITFGIEAFVTEAPPMRRAAMENMPVCSWEL